MDIAIACGGTGGHIFPGLATANVLKEHGHNVTLWLSGRDVELEAVEKWEGPVVTVPAEGFPTRFSLRGVRAAWRLFRAGMRCRAGMREQRPDVLLAMGSYASAGPVLGALTCGVPVVLHEANVLPGRAIALFSRWATAVAGSFEETRFYLKRKALVLTGMPLRPGLEHPVHDTLPEGMDRDHFTLLVMGGSQGARAINDTVSRAVCALGTSSRLQVIHITGHADEASVRKLYLEQGIVHKVEAFVQNMASLYAAADLAICRAGAATCAELSVFGVPALLVPHPHGAHQHQMANARAMEKRGAADVIPEDDFTEEWVQEYISEYVQHPARLAKMSEASVKRGTRGGAAKLAELVESVGNQTYTPTDTTAGHDD